MLPTLLLRDETSDAAWQVWPDAQVVPPAAVQETRTYVFELHDAPEASDAALIIDDEELEGLRPRAAVAARWRWSPGFHAGTVEAELRVRGRPPQRFEIITDPDLRKLTRDDFDIMVREILDDTFALFALSSFRKGVTRGAGNRPPPLARLEFLRSRVEELEETAGAIARRPRRILLAEDHLVPHYRAVRATGPEIIRSLRSGRLLRETHGAASRLPPALKGYLPENIRVRQRRNSLDLPEHRQMAACLRSWSGWLVEAAGLLAGAADDDDADLRRRRRAWAVRCRRLARRLARLAELQPFSEAGEGQPRLHFSQLFRTDPAYSRFFRLWQDMNAGIAAVFGDFLQMPLARTFDLYELWCFLRLVRAGAERWGPSGVKVTDLFINDAAGGVTLRRDSVTVPVGRGWKLCFQKHYQEFWKEPDGHGSFSRVMVPDIVAAGSGVENDQLPKLIVLDAKYRIDAGLAEALNSIHSYSHALVREIPNNEIQGIVTAAYLLAPSMPQLRLGYRDTEMPGRLFHPEYRQSFRFGAVALRPGMTQTDIAAALEKIVADATAV